MRVMLAQIAECRREPSGTSKITPSQSSRRVPLCLAIATYCSKEKTGSCGMASMRLHLSREAMGIQRAIPGALQALGGAARRTALAHAGCGAAAPSVNENDGL